MDEAERFQIRHEGYAEGYRVGRDELDEQIKREYAEKHNECARWRDAYWDLRHAIEALAPRWRELAMSVNDPRSPSLLVECEADVDEVLDQHRPPR